jgi:hypothetical protein
VQHNFFTVMSCLQAQNSFIDSLYPVTPRARLFEDQIVQPEGVNGRSRICRYVRCCDGSSRLLHFSNSHYRLPRYARVGIGRGAHV